jgi:acetyl esterase/lipase
LRPGAGFEDHLADARAALAWARVHAEEYAGDPSRLVVAGSSAGAHLAALCALTATAQEPVAAAVGLYGYYGRYYGRPDDKPVASTPFALDAAAAPPFLLAHGERDNYTPADAARALAQKLRAESSGPVVHVELPGGQHGFDLLHSWRLAAVISACEAFLAEVASPRHEAEPTPREHRESQEATP